MEFRLTFKNAKVNNSYYQTCTTDYNGNLDVGTIEIEDPAQTIEITIREITPADGYNYYGFSEMTIILRHKEGITEIEGNTGYANARYNINDNIVYLEIDNEVTIDLQGKV